LSLCASLTVPLFLQIISNNLLENSNDGAYQDKNYFILAGFCVLASFYSKRFLDDLYSKVNKIESTAEKAEKSATEAEKYIESQLEAEQFEIETNTNLNTTEDKKIESIKEKLDNLDTLADSDRNTYLKNKADSEIKTILRDLQNSKYKDRSIKGISRTAKIHEANVRIIVHAFIKTGIVIPVQWYGKEFYRLTPQGKIANLIE
jgi:hypothetical protein